MSNNYKKRLLTEREAKEYLNCSRSTLYRLRKAGMIQYVQLGSRIRYRMEDLDAYLRTNLVHAVNQKGGSHE